MALIFVTGNRHKFEEVSQLAAEHCLRIEMRDVKYAEIQADELVTIACHGAKKACEKIRAPAFVEDAGLFVRALRGFPGPYSSFVFRAMGNEGVLKLMRGVSDRRAEFRSTIGYCEPGSEPVVFEGVVRGSITTALRGSRGFGFDPIFQPVDSRRTFGEMNLAEKNEFSHRARAMKKFIKWHGKRRKAEGLEI